MKQEMLHSFGAQQLLFGLHWQPIVGQASPQKAKLIARKQKAKAWVMAGHTFINVGLSYKSVSRKKVIYAAAVCYALLHPKGWHAAIYQLNSNTYWLAVAHEGTPMSLGDVLFANEQDALDALTRLTHQYPELISTPQIIALANFLALVSTHALQKTTLHPLRAPSWRPLVFMVCVLGALYWWRLEPAPVVQAAPVPEVDPYFQYWQQNKIQPNGKDALRKLIFSWHSIPLRLQDWQLQTVRCEAESRAPRWICEMHYTPLVETASVAQLEPILPKDWQIKQLSMQSAVLKNYIDFVGASSGWRTAQQVQLDLLSQLQHVRPAFSALRLAEPSALAQGVNHSSNYSPIFAQRLNFEGPLRSLPLLVDLDDALHWHRVSLIHKPQRTPSLKSSALQVSAQGVIYVRD